MKYGQKDLGSYSDSALGHSHARNVLADLLSDNFWRAQQDAKQVCMLNDWLNELRGEMSDDAGEEYDALDWLNDHCCEQGFYFDFDNGEVCLFQEREPQNDL